MPGLLRGVARTAVVAGTATAVAGRVQRRQASRFAERDAETAAKQDAAYQEQVAEQEPPPPAPAPSGSDMLEQLKTLGELRDQGVLTQEEFDAQKAKILG
ncbi:SHOCT domain-containing protein [Pedococcus sp. KACC 23699]|uniref:SHOCT domain-containing protein n=1 Tax=Pedococcus sp. KACC 23699 TaxID=3149228 RepID=A0AAU7JST3_9MICO